MKESVTDWSFWWTKRSLLFYLQRTRCSVWVHVNCNLFARNCRSQRRKDLYCVNMINLENANALKNLEQVPCVDNPNSVSFCFNSTTLNFFNSSTVGTDAMLENNKVRKLPNRRRYKSVVTSQIGTLLSRSKASEMIRCVHNRKFKSSMPKSNFIEIQETNDRHEHDDGNTSNEKMEQGRNLQKMNLTTLLTSKLWSND